MTPYYQDDAVTIYHGRCEDVLPTLPAADLILTDVPYNVVNRESAGLRLLDRGGADSSPFDVAWGAGQFARSTVGSVYAFCATEQVSGLRSGLVDAGMSTRLGIWHKTNPSPMNGEALWLSAVECCVFGRHPKAWFGEFCAHPVWEGPSEPRDDHPTPKPEWLMKRLILASCPPGGLVVDPYVGSGTTLRAAKDLGRPSIGIELNEAFCEIAAKRMGQEVLDFGGAA